MTRIDRQNPVSGIPSQSIKEDNPKLEKLSKRVEQATKGAFPKTQHTFDIKTTPLANKVNQARSRVI